MTRRRLIIISIFLLALALRLFLIPNRGFEADVSFWKSWGLAAVDHNVIWSIENTNNNYPTPFAYILGFLTSFYSIFRDPHNFNEFWNNENVLFLLIIKFPSIIADLSIAAIILWIGKNAKKIGFPVFSSSLYIVLAALYLFNPLSLIDGVWWGQVDALGVCLFLLSCVFAFTHKSFLAGVCFMVSMMMKLQNMIYAPLFFLLLWQLNGWKGCIQGILGAVIAFFGLNIEFLLHKKMDLVIGAITQNYNYFPLLSLNAYNPWWIISNAHGMQISDKILSVGIINAKTVGLMLFSGTYLLALCTMLTHTWKKMWNHTKKSNTHTNEEVTDQSDILFSFFTGLIIVCGGFFLFQTESHDRYAFPIAVFLLFWGVLYIFRTSTERMRTAWWKTTSFILFLIGYITFSLVYFCNFHTAFIINYPKNCIPFLLFLKEPFWTLLCSYIITGLFFLFLIINKKTIGWIAFLVPSSLFLVLCVFLNLPLLTKSPVSLTQFAPLVSQQGYGKQTINMPTNASGPSKTWNRLSVQYSFYEKGIGTHAKSYIVYNIGAHFQRFTTDMGVDTEAGPQGSVVFAVYGDDKLLYQGDTIKRYEYPRHADIDIRGVKKLSLSVEDGGNGITDDHADWLNPLLFP